MDKHNPKQQNNAMYRQIEVTPIDSIKIKHMNRLKNRKAKNTANNFYTLGTNRSFRTVFDSII